jgi:hypothetical protein
MDLLRLTKGTKNLSSRVLQVNEKSKATRGSRIADCGSGNEFLVNPQSAIANPQ